MNNIIWCQLGDCSHAECHHCFPVKNCRLGHKYCNENGICDDILLNVNESIEEYKTKAPYESVVLITGSCGFIGFHLSYKLLSLGYTIIGVDMYDSFVYDSSFKVKNSENLKKFKNYIEYNENILDRNHIIETNPDIIIHLAAYANVRKSIEYPDMYVKNNIECTCKLLNQIQKCHTKPLFIYASSSSVYGKNIKVPFEESDSLLNIESPYALSKKVSEEYVQLFCKIYKIQSIGLRFFTVYGPGGRPDMAIFNFLDKIQKDEPIVMYGDGSMERDYTFVLDIVEGIYSCLNIRLREGEHKIYNLGNNSPVKLSKIISICEKVTGKRAIVVQNDVPIGDVPITYANINRAKIELGYNPTTNIETGISEMYNWMKN
jgi:UDP-glucuronate 4-epimerase